MIINDQPFSLPRYCGISGAISMVEGPVCAETTVNNWCVLCMLSTASSECYHDGMFKLVHCHAQGLHCKVMRLPWNTELHVVFMNYLLKMLHVQWLNWSTVCLYKHSVHTGGIALLQNLLCTIWVNTVVLFKQQVLSLCITLFCGLSKYDFTVTYLLLEQC